MPERKELRHAAAARWDSAFTGQWWLVSAFWLLLTFAVILAESLEFPYDITHSLRVASTRWLPWVFLTPALSWLTARYSLERGSWTKSIGIYLVACVVIVTGLGALAGFTQDFSSGDHQPGFRHDDFPDHFHGPHGRDHFPSDSTHPPSGPRSGFGSGRMNSVQFVQLASIQLPTFWLVVLALHGLRFYQHAKERERHAAELQSSLTSARLQALRMQLNPHFLFNTLNSIASLIHENPAGADEMVGSLSELLRLTLASNDRQEAPLREELHLLDLYLRIEQTRFGERLKVKMEIEPAALDVLVPFFILQPLAENAVRHGLESQLQPLLILVTAKPTQSGLVLEVIDNGRGPAVTGTGEIKEGVGLSNTRGRLQALYGDKASMEIGRPEGGGCRVELKMPWRTVFNPGASSATK